MADKRCRTKRPSITPEEILAKAFRAKCRFKAIVRFAHANQYWLNDIEDEELGEDIQKNVIVLLRRKEKKSLALMDKAILSKPTDKRTEMDKIHLNRVIGGLKCFRRYPSDVKAELAAVTYFVYYGPGRVVVREGDLADSLYFVITGDLIVKQLTYDPILDTYINQEIGRRGPGAMFGEVSLLHGVPRTATIVTSTHCEFLRLRKGDFDVVLKATVQEQWDNIGKAMSLFTYFENWDEVNRRECCILSKIQNFNKDETILGDSVGLNDHVYFLMNGTCRIIHHLTVIPYIHNGKKLYKLYEPKFSQRNVLEYDGISSYSKVNALSTLDIISKTADEHEDDYREMQTVQSSMKIAEKLSTANLPRDVEVHFMQVCFLKRTACFGLGENFEHRRVVACTDAQCLLIPRYWLYQRNVGNIWNRIVLYLNTNVPSTQQVFREFLNQRRWLKHRKQVIDDFASTKKSVSHAVYSDIPLYSRVYENNSRDID